MKKYQPLFFYYCLDCFYISPYKEKSVECKKCRGNNIFFLNNDYNLMFLKKEFCMSCRKNTKELYTFKLKQDSYTKIKVCAECVKYIKKEKMITDSYKQPIPERKKKIRNFFKAIETWYKKYKTIKTEDDI